MTATMTITVTVTAAAYCVTMDDVARLPSRAAAQGESFWKILRQALLPSCNNIPNAVCPGVENTGSPGNALPRCPCISPRVPMY